MKKPDLQLGLFSNQEIEAQVEQAREKAKAVAMMDKLTVKMVRHEEDVAKKALLKREEENFTRIFIFKCYNGWMKVYDNSAMIVSTWLDGRLGRRYERNDDGGYGASAKYGAVSIPPDSVEEFLRALNRAGMKFVFASDWVIEYDIGERITQEEMVRMLHEDELIIDRVNKLVMPKEVLPGLRGKVRGLLDYIHTQIRNQRDTTKVIFLNDVERQAVEANKMVIAASRGRMPVNSCLNEVGRYVEEMYENATTMSDLRLISAKQYKGFVDLIREVENEQSRLIKRKIAETVDEKIEETKKRRVGSGQRGAAAARGERAGAA